MKVDRAQSILNIRANPSEEESQRWASMTEEQIQNDIEHYLERAIPERIRGIQDAQDIVATLDDLAAAIPRTNRRS